MPELAENALVVFVSDSHIGGDPGCDGFESPEELAALFDELAALERPVELVLAGDFFDFLQIGEVPRETDKAALTTSRPEYADLFASLKHFGAGNGKRTVYLPGNHDAEAWWNPRIKETLRSSCLVDEFAYSYLAYIRVGGGRRVIYCEHGNQLDPVNTVANYADGLDTPLGHHIVTDFTRRVAPYGEVSPGLDLAEIKMVYPLVAIPAWIAGRFFYDFVGKVTKYLLLPLLAAYALYRTAAHLVALARGDRGGFFGESDEIPQVHELFLGLAIFGLVTLLVFAVFFLVIRHLVRRTLRAVSPRTGKGARRPGYSPAQASQEKIEGIVRGDSRPPMSPSLDPTTVDVFVSGHTHLPSLTKVDRPDGRRCATINSGCFLRQLHPVPARAKGPPIFVSRFVLTHVRVEAKNGALRAELWEQPKRASQSLTRIERLLSSGRRPSQPEKGAEPRVVASDRL